MRIIGGMLGGRKIQPPAKMPYTRPTTDIAKEGLFNILENNCTISGMSTLDLFGGTGSITFELCSRGATDCTVIEKDKTMADFIVQTAAQLQCANIRVLRNDVFRFIDQCREQYDFIFAGPPYALNTIDDLPPKIFEKNILKPKAWFVLEHTPRNDYKHLPQFATTRNYGTTVFTVFVNR
ncbi:MAG TPA: RsmD family RNA methyltransferase [Flavitalea sp.]|nr:RsmD family RNA methyltransferase [Flavitalea sp.]